MRASLSLIPREAGLKADRLETAACVTLEQVPGNFATPAIHLVLNAQVPGATGVVFQELAGKAKAGCPVSKVLNAAITRTRRAGDAQLAA